MPTSTSAVKKPSPKPTRLPTFRPTPRPTSRPTARPSGRPSGRPSSPPSKKPTTKPTGKAAAAAPKAKMNSAQIIGTLFGVGAGVVIIYGLYSYMKSKRDQQSVDQEESGVEVTNPVHDGDNKDYDDTF